MSWQARRGLGVTAQPGRHGEDGHLLAWHGEDWHGLAGTASIPLPLAFGTGTMPLWALHPFFFTMTQYVYSDGTDHISGVDAQTAGEELARIKAEHGFLQPAVVVDESRPDDAPLHPAFEWRDPVAAEQWREHQATAIIRRVRVLPVDTAPSPQRQQRGRVMMPPPEPLEECDPLLFELDEAAKAVIQAQDRVQRLRKKAQERFDRRRQVSAGIALANLEEADGLLEDARESLTAGRQSSEWAPVNA